MGANHAAMVVFPYPDHKIDTIILKLERIIIAGYPKILYIYSNNEFKCQQKFKNKRKFEP